MKYGGIGTGTSSSEVTDISPFGIWILHWGKEYFLSYEEFPWFKDAPVRKVFAVTNEGEDHLRWPELDASSLRASGRGHFTEKRSEAPDIHKSQCGSVRNSVRSAGNLRAPLRRLLI